MKNLFFLACIVLMQSCNHRSFGSKRDLLIYLTNNENGYIQHKSVNGINFSLMFRPTDLLVEHELSDNFQEADINALRSKYKDHLYFNLSLEKNNREVLTQVLGNRDKYRQLLYQLSFDMEDKIVVSTQKKDTVPAVDCIYPRMYDLDGKNTVMLIVPRTDELLKGKFIMIAVADLGLSTGEVAFRFPVDLIKNEPRLEF